MRPIERIRRTAATPRSTFAVRPYGTTRGEAAVAKAAAEGDALTTGGSAEAVISSSTTDDGTQLK